MQLVRNCVCCIIQVQVPPLSQAHLRALLFDGDYNYHSQHPHNTHVPTYLSHSIHPVRVSKLQPPGQIQLVLVLGNKVPKHS